MRRYRTYNEVEEDAGADIVRQVEAQHRRLAERLASVDRVWLVASGKGGVGKSMIAANLAAALGARGARVGALDADLNGPSLARMLGVEPGPLRVDDHGLHPAAGAGGTRVLSTDLLLATPDTPVRWGRQEAAEVTRSALETSALREFLGDVAWGALDHLLLDLPPGTDRLERALALVQEPAGILVITTPSEAAGRVVRRSLRVARDAGAAHAIVANMAGYICPDCGSRHDLFGADAASALADETGTELWAEIPFHPDAAAHTDRGRPIVLQDPANPAAEALLTLARRLESRGSPDGAQPATESKP